MTPAERKRFIWTMVAITFFFANLIAGAILVFNSMERAGKGGGAPAATSASQP